MNRLRFSGSAWLETCSAETVVPRMTKMSTLLSSTEFQNCWVRCGDKAAATVTPALRISRSRSLINSGLMSSA